MNIKIKLNDDSASEANVAKAAKSRIDAGAGETLEEAFSRILSSKSVNDSVKSRMLAVKEALESGDISRESSAYKKDGSLKRFGKAEAERLYKILEEREKKRVLQEMKETMPDNYHLIQDEDQLEKAMTALSSEDTIVFDVESTGVDVWTDYIVGYVLTATSLDEHYYIPTRHETDEVQLDHEHVTRQVKTVMERTDVLYIAHNAKYDIHMLKNEGITFKGRLWDTQEGMKLLNENEGSFALKNLVTKYLGIDSMTYGQLFGKNGFHTVSDLKIATSYAAKDGDVTYKLYQFQVEHLSKRFPTIYKYALDVEMPIIPVVVDMERTGFTIDGEYAERYGEELTAELDAVSERIDAILGDINLNSPAQVKEALEAHTGRTLENTDAKKTLKPLSETYPVIADILQYKKLSKLIGTYVETLPKAVNDETGKLMANFNTNGAKTGRFSSGGGGINLQNQPGEARKLFIADEGRVLLGGDWSQQEYRALAYFSQEPKLLKYYYEGRDLYQEVASEIFSVPKEECGDGSAYRGMTKVVLLAIAYGTGANTLAGQLGKTKGEAQKILNDFKRSHPTLKAWLEHNQEFVQRYGYVWMDGKQRKRRLPDALDRNSDFWYSATITQSTNAVIQGSAAIQTKATMVEMDKLCKRKTAEGKGEWRILAPIHDELIIDVPDTITEADVQDFVDVMVETYKFGDVPNKTDVELYKRWGVPITLDEWFNKEEAS